MQSRVVRVGATYRPVTDTSQHPYLVLAMLIALAVGFALGPLALAWAWAKFFSPQKPGKDKNAIYECGLESKGDAWIQFRSEYYLYAIIFLVFDVETIFLFPWAVRYRHLGWFGVMEVAVFLAILVVGYIWAFKKGALEWV